MLSVQAQRVRGWEWWSRTHRRRAFACHGFEEYCHRRQTDHFHPPVEWRLLCDGERREERGDEDGSGEEAQKGTVETRQKIHTCSYSDTNTPFRVGDFIESGSCE